MLTNTSIEIIFRMFFLTLSNANIWFGEKKLMWRSYTMAEALPITKRIEFINRKEFAALRLAENEETFMVYIITLFITRKISIHSF